MKKLNEIKERWSKTTPGEWTVKKVQGSPDYSPNYGVKTDKGYTVVHATSDWEGYGNGSTKDDATAISHAPRDVATLTNTLEEILQLCENIDDTATTQADGVHVPVYLILETIQNALGESNDG